MPTHLLRTTHGDVSYALRRRTAGGAWHYRFWVKAKEHRGSTKTIDLAQAKLATEKQINIQLRPVLPGAANVAQLKSAVDQYLDSRWPEKETRHRDRYFKDCQHRLKFFREFLGDAAPFVTLPLEDARLALQHWLDKRRSQKKSACTLHNDQKVVSKFCSWMMQRRLAAWQANPADKKSLDLPRLYVQPKKAADPETIEKLLRKAENRVVYPVIVLMCSGLRTVGCTRLQWKDVHLGEKPLVRVPIEKGMQRTVPLSQWAAEKLAAWKLKHPPKSENFRVYPGDSNNASRDLRLLRGDDTSITFGSMRRMASTRLYQAGVTPQLAAKIMGHSVRIALQHYVQLEAMNAHEAVQALDYATKPAQKPAHDPLTTPDQQKTRKA